MKRRHFIGVDVHGKFLELAVVDAEGRKVSGRRCATTIPALVAELAKVARRVPCFRARLLKEITHPGRPESMLMHQ